MPVAEKQTLRVFRARLGLNQKQLAELVGITPTALGDIEKGKSVPRLDTAWKIVNALNSILRRKGQSPITPESLEWEYHE